AAQSVSCYPIDVKDLNADFLVFSGHKMFGPMGVGVLYAEEKHWSEILPLNFGGGAIKNVELEETRFMDYPFNLEAGTPNVGGVFGLDTAIEFIQQLDIEECTAHIEKLGNTFRDKISTEQGFKVLGSPQKRSGIVSFYHDKIHPHDIASFLGSQNVAVRAGHHCTQPLLQAMGVPATVRASFSIYNSLSDVDKAMDSLKDLKKFWS
ncbi:MAG: aminotransferase class V-fold PLP-dependent enzyme, partial [Cyclobacteriaceae bacterium]